MQSATTAVMTGALLLTLLSLGKADVYPGDAAFQNICQEIVDGVAGNLIEFKKLVTTCSGWLGCSSSLQIRETITRQTLCDRLTSKHNSNNAAYLGGTAISSSECQSALLAPASYGIPEWNRRSGRHCGTWRSTDSSGTVTQTFTDHALFSTAVQSGSIGVVRQSVTFLTRPSCCNDAWTESGGNVCMHYLHR